MTIKDVADAISSQYGAIFLLILILATGIAGKWVFGWIYVQEHEEKKEWRDLALSLLGAGKRALDIIEKKDETP